MTVPISYQNVYQPVLRVIRKKKLLKKFRKRTESDLYVWIIKRWDELKNKYGASFPHYNGTDDVVHFIW
jgi:hypothetical protein